MPYLIDMSYGHPLIKALFTKDAFFILQKLLRRFKKVLHRYGLNTKKENVARYEVVVRF